jgi:predicted lipoprotein with Yx(FWY)xxD motif
VSRPGFTGVAAVLAVATLVAGAVLLIARPGGRAKRGQGRRAAAVTGPTLGVARTRLGPILVDARGRTLYVSTKDTGGRSTCTGKCTRVWPPALAAGEPRLGAGIRASRVSIERRRDGRRQLAYYGHPLYTLTADTGPHQITGQGFEGRWYVVTAAGRVLAPHGGAPAAGY